LPTPTPNPTTASVSPKNVDLGAAGGCPGAVLTTTIAVTAPATTTWTVAVVGSLTPADTLGSATLDRTGGTGSGLVTLTVRLNPQQPTFSSGSCNNTYTLKYGDTVYFGLSSSPYYLDMRVTYTYIAVF
jgi:hypothetical protein